MPQADANHSTTAPTTRLTYETYSQAPGYRDLTLKLTDPKTGKEYDLDLRPADVQRVIWACAEVAKQIGDLPPIDWEAYRSQIFWPTITPWKVGESAPQRHG